MTDAPRSDLPRPDAPAQRNLKIYDAVTLTLRSDIISKHHQPHRRGTPDWIENYSRRSSVEGAFGGLKARSGQGMTRGWTRVMGITATALMTAAAIVQYNIQAIRSWATKNAIDDGALYDAEPGTDIERLRLNAVVSSPQRPGAPPAI